MSLPEKNLAVANPQKSRFYPIIRTIVIEPDTRLATNLSYILSAHDLTDIVCNTHSVESALTYFEKEHEYRWPELIFISAKLSHTDLLWSLQRFKAINPQLKIIVLGPFRPYAELMALFKAGLCAYLGPHTQDPLIRYSVLLVCYEKHYCLHLPFAKTALCVIAQSHLEILRFDGEFNFNPELWNSRLHQRSHF
jgi:hypothetical protein